MMSEIEITVSPINSADHPLGVISDSPFKPYRFISKEFHGEIDRIVGHEVKDLIHGKSGQAFAGWIDGEMVGLIAYDDLPWDSRVIGRRMGSIRQFYIDPSLSTRHVVAQRLVEHVVQYALSLQVECLVCKAYTDDIVAIHALETNGFLLMDTLLDYVYDLERFPLRSVSEPQLADGASIRLADSNDQAGLMQVAEACFHGHFGRYHVDEQIPQGVADQVYLEWIKSSLVGYADWVVLAEVDSRIAGYSVWRRPSQVENTLSVRVGHYSIGAVHPDFSGRKLFSALTFAGMKLFDGVAHVIEGPTHINNYPVQRGYARLNWHIGDARHSFHKWLV